ncbi:MAG: efflux transporter outer membrane subunit [Muribaculaceae bacterium]|nr:efflux transporter outer membrane subunit [Muribaculaceae bacterium]
MSRHVILLLVSLIIAGCSGVKNLSKPEVDIPEQFSVGTANDSLCIADLEWWKFYSDSTLCGFIRRTLENNKDLAVAASKIEELRQLYGVERVNLMPTLSGNVYANDETNDYSGSGITHDREIGLKVSVAWEINLLGAQSWARKKAGSNYMASVEDYRALQLSLIATTAEIYYRMAALENELEIVNHTVESRKESLRMARIRFDGGLTSETVYQQAMVEYSSAASKLPDLKKRLNATRNALTMLMGQTPQDTLEIELQQLTPLSGSKLPVGVPSDLMQRRPDIRAAELRLAASLANAGYQYADRFPSLQLGFTPGFENNELKKFFQSPFTFIVGSVTGPIFDFGKKKRKYEAAVAVYEQSRSQYEKAVIQAFTEVNTAIEAYKDARESAILKHELCMAAEKYIQLAQLQYRAGSLNYIDVLDAQRRYFDAQIDVNNAIRDEYLALIALYKALGGGWVPPGSR